MRKIVLIMVFAMALPLLCAAEDWSNVSLIDTKCAAKAKADPDAHTRACAMQCAKGGFGILTKDGQYLKLDDNGNKEALKLLESSDKKDHIRVNVSGEVKGDTIAVKSVKM